MQHSGLDVKLLADTIRRYHFGSRSHVHGLIGLEEVGRDIIGLKYFHHLSSVYKVECLLEVDEA